TCPHGNPIPGSGYAAPEAVPLAELEVGSTFTVIRIPEELEFTPGLLEFLEEAAIQPGHRGVVTAVSPDGTTTVEVEGAHVGLGALGTLGVLVPGRAGVADGRCSLAAPAGPAEGGWSPAPRPALGSRSGRATPTRLGQVPGAAHPAQPGEHAGERDE